MIKSISNSFVPILKWTSVAAVTAAVVISIQASADGHGKAVEATPDVNASALKAQELGTATDALTGTPVAQITPTRRTVPWTPANGFADLIEDVSPAVVHVATAGFIQQRRFAGRQGNPNSRQFRSPRSLEEYFNELFGGRRMPNDPRQQEPDEEQDPDLEKETRPLGIGSGFVISADGYVVTNHHVIDRADEIVVTLTDGTEYEAEIKGSDPKTDLALLKLKDAQDLPFVPWGNDEDSRVGDWVLAIGNPFGLGGSASTGIISAIGRDIQAGPYDDFIQVDAAINRGNSGGPLFNMQGEVIGINSMIYSPTGGSVGIGFSIPATLAKGVIAQLQDSGSVRRGWIGVSIRPISEELAKAFKRDDEEGALISQVIKDSPAEEAGIEAGDIILKFNGEPIKTMRNLPREVANAVVGKLYKIEVWRDGKLKKMKIKTAPFPEDDEVADAQEPEEAVEPETDELLGADLVELTDETRRRYRVGDDVEGVLITDVQRGGLADKNRLIPGDVIVQFGENKDISSPEQIIKILKATRKAGEDAVLALVYRRGNRDFFVFKVK